MEFVPLDTAKINFIKTCSRMVHLHHIWRCDDFTMVTVYPDLLSGKPDQYRNSLLGQLQLTQLLPFNTTGKPCLGSLHKSRVCIHGWDATTQCWPACEISAASAGWVGGMLLDTAGYIKQHSPYPTSTGRHYAVCARRGSPDRATYIASPPSSTGRKYAE